MLPSLRDLLPALALCAMVLPYALAVDIPQHDPFYDAPAGYENMAPGSILRTRSIIPAYFGLIPDPIEAWQLLYRTTAINGTAIASATTIFKPRNAQLDRFVSFQTAYDGAARSGVCDPSYSYQLFAPQTGLISSLEFFILQTYLAKGYIVQSADYEGPDAAIGAGRLSAMNVLDSMRAVSKFQSTLGLITATPKIIGYGYSGGAIATGWAASLHSSYAPELDVVGWVQGGTPVNLTATALFLDGTLFAGYLPQIMVGLNTPSAYGAQIAPLFDRILNTNGSDTLKAAAQICGVQNLLTFPFGQIQNTNFQSLGDRIFYEPTLASILAKNTMGVNPDETPTAPVYLFHAANDEIVPYSESSTLYAGWCASGASVHFTTIANGGHINSEILDLVGISSFVDSAFAGTVARGCSTSIILNNFQDPKALGADLEPIVVGLINTLAKAGRQDIHIKSNLQTLTQTVDS